MSSFDFSCHSVSRVVSDSGVNGGGTGSWCDLVIFANDRLANNITLTLFFEDTETGPALEKALKAIWPE